LHTARAGEHYTKKAGDARQYKRLQKQHIHTSTFAHFYPQQWFLYHTGLYYFNFNFKFSGAVCYGQALVFWCRSGVAPGPWAAVQERLSDSEWGLGREAVSFFMVLRDGGWGTRCKMEKDDYKQPRR
jgi:hypothetical protein